MRFWLVNGTLHTAISPEPLRADILVENGKIAAIGQADCGRTVDCSGLQIYPGLVEAHCHIGVHGFAIGYEGMDVNERNEPLSQQLRAIDGFNPFDKGIERTRRAGVTCIATGPGSADVLGGTFMAVKTVGTCVDDMVVKDCVAMKCAFGENPKKCYQNKSISNRMTTAAKLRGALAKARDYLRKIDEAEATGGKRPDFDLGCEALLLVLRGEIPLKAHAHQANDIMTAIRIAKEFGVKVTIEHCTEGHLIAAELARAGVPVAVGPTMIFGGKPELGNRSFETPAILDKAGCPVSIITDAPVIPPEFLALSASFAVKAGMDPFHALQAITINPARHLGISDRVGSLEVGKDADIVVTDGDILNPLSSVKAVYIDGNAVL